MSDDFCAPADAGTAHPYAPAYDIMWRLCSAACRFDFIRDVYHWDPYVTEDDLEMPEFFFGPPPPPYFGFHAVV